MKVVKEVDDLLSAEGLLDAERISCLNIKLQQLEAKLKILSDIDKDILSKYNIDDIEHEINESQAVNTSIMDRQRGFTKPLNP